MDQLKRRIRLYKTAAAHGSDAATGDGAQRHHYYHFFEEEATAEAEEN